MSSLPLLLLLQLLDLPLRSHLIDKCVGAETGGVPPNGGAARSRQSSGLPAVIIDDLNNSMPMPARPSRFVYAINCAAVCPENNNNSLEQWPKTGN